MSKSPLFHRPDVDGLRAVAIFGVLLFHAFPQWLPGGFVGVDVFFVISGFVVMHSLQRHPIQGMRDVLAFYARRARRLFPALALVLLTCAGLGYLLLPQAMLAQLGKHMLGSAAFVQNWVLWSEAGYFDTDSHQKWLLHLWSLGIEEQFYWLLPLLMWAIGHAPRLKPLMQPWGWRVLAGLSFAAALWLSLHHPSAAFFWPLGRFWEFLAGVMLAQAQQSTAWRGQQRTEHWHNAVAWLASAGLGLAFWALREAPWGTWHFPGWQALWPVLCTVCLIRCRNSWLNTRVLSAAPMQYLGRISYPLYLWHWPLLAYLNALDPSMQWTWPRWAAVALALALACTTYHALERPVHRHTTGAWPWWLVMAGVAAVGTWLWKNPPPQSALVAPTPLEAPRWAGDARYRDAICLQHQGVNPWARNDFFCLGDPDRAPMALLGDSHANALSAGLLDAMPQQWLNLGGGGCMPFDAVDSGSAQTGLQCPAEMPAAFVQHLVRSAHIHTVVVLLRGPLYLEGTGWGAAEAHTQRWLRMDGQTAPHATARTEWFRDGMLRTLDALGDRKKQVIWLLNTPEMGLNLEACIRPMWGSGWLAPAPVCDVPRDAFEARSARYRHLIAQTVAHWNAQRPEGAPHVRVLDPAEALCLSHTCPLAIDGQVLYRDGDHLSEQGALRVAKWLLPHLAP